MRIISCTPNGITIQQKVNKNAKYNPTADRLQSKVIWPFEETRDSMLSRYTQIARNSISKSQNQTLEEYTQGKTRTQHRLKLRY
jgi:hypothetical protein